MLRSLRKLLRRYIPEHFADPVGLTTRLIRSGNPAARFALLYAGCGLLAAPVDLLLSPWERSLYRKAKGRRYPLILVCGPPRSGTTLVYQTLVNHLDLAYFNNLTSLFPRSPLLAMRLIQRFFRHRQESYNSYYGRTAPLSGTNDALFLWDRWLGENRIKPPQEISPQRAQALRRFFAACEAEFQKPLVNKNNNLNLSANLVHDCLPEVYFICLERSPVALARSLYNARKDIHGSSEIPYGIRPAGNDHTGSGQTDSVESVCEQVLFYDRQAEAQLRRIGPEHFWRVSYEDFCHNPGALVTRVAREILGDASLLQGTPPESFKISEGHSLAEPMEEQIAAFFAKRAMNEQQLVDELKV